MRVGNRYPWIRKSDYVVIDESWFFEPGKSYRLRRGLNDIVVHDACKTLLRVFNLSPQGQSMSLRRTFEDGERWQREFPLLIQLAHHADRHPVTFSSRRIER